MMKAAVDAVCLEAPKTARGVLSESLRSLAQTLAEQRCRWIHRAISHPINGKYRCWECLREFETGW